MPMIPAVPFTRLRQLRSPEHQERREEDDDGRHIDDDLRRDDRSGTDDRAGRGGSRARYRLSVPRNRATTRGVVRLVGEFARVT